MKSQANDPNRLVHLGRRHFRLNLDLAIRWCCQESSDANDAKICEHWKQKKVEVVDFALVEFDSKSVAKPFVVVVAVDVFDEFVTEVAVEVVEFDMDASTDAIESLILAVDEEVE